MDTSHITDPTTDLTDPTNPTYLTNPTKPEATGAAERVAALREAIAEKASRQGKIAMQDHQGRMSELNSLIEYSEGGYKQDKLTQLEYIGTTVSRIMTISEIPTRVPTPVPTHDIPTQITDALRTILYICYKARKTVFTNDAAGLAALIDSYLVTRFSSSDITEALADGTIRTTPYAASCVCGHSVAVNTSFLGGLKYMCPYCDTIATDFKTRLTRYDMQTIIGAINTAYGKLVGINVYTLENILANAIFLSRGNHD